MLAAYSVPSGGYGCIACHSLEGQGGAVGPALDGVGNRIKQADIEKWLANPKAVRADAKMPQLPLSKDQIIELAAFLTTLHK